MLVDFFDYCFLLLKARKLNKALKNLQLLKKVESEFGQFFTPEEQQLSARVVSQASAKVDEIAAKCTLAYESKKKS